MKIHDQKGFSGVEIILAVAIVGVISVAGYFAYQNMSTRSNDTKVTATQTPVADNGAKFTHPTAGYSLSYPANWKGGLVTNPAGTTPVYQDFNIKSPDYRVATQYPVLETGGEMAVTATKSNVATVADAYKSNQIAARIDRNKSMTKVDGQEAIQVDYSFEQVNATKTLFIKDGVLYEVSVRYVDEKGKQALSGEYAKLLASFKLR